MVDDLGGDFAGRAQVGADKDAGLTIGGAAFGVEFGDGGLRIGRFEQGAMVLVADAFPDGVGRGPQAHDEGVGTEVFEVGGIADEAAAGGDDEFVPGGEIGDDGAFVGAEAGFAFGGEDFGDGLSHALGDEVVCVDKLEAQLLGNDASDGGFADTHEPDQGQIANGMNVAHAPIV